MNSLDAALARLEVPTGLGLGDLEQVDPEWDGEAIRGGPPESVVVGAREGERVAP
jgi:hypothetical protein